VRLRLVDRGRDRAARILGPLQGKQVGDGVWKGRCVRVKGDKPQKLTFLFGGSDLDWF